jgi:hypothetical protein
MKEIKKKIKKSPLFYFHGNCGKVCPTGSFWHVDKIQNGRCCHGNQGAKIVKFIPNFKKLYSNVSCHMQICKQILSFKMAAVSLWKLLMG